LDRVGRRHGRIIRGSVMSRGKTMLELSPEQNQIDVAWELVEAKTRLPEKWHNFFEQLGLAPHHSGCRRAYQRYFIRGKAILRCRDSCFGVYSADASRGGIRFLAPMEMQIGERARIRLPNTKEFQVEIVRCRHMEDCCYDCGAIFVLGK
jgi:hypothetical protein